MLVPLHRNSFDAILEIAERLAARLKEQGPDQAMDIDGALQCESFDVIGRIGFNHDFNATEDLLGPGAAGCRTIKEGKGQRTFLSASTYCTRQINPAKIYLLCPLKPILHYAYHYRNFRGTCKSHDSFCDHMRLTYTPLSEHVSSTMA